MNRLFGWQNMSDRIVNLMTSIDKAVLIYPHTSIWDTVTMISYICSDIRIHGKFWPVIRKAPVGSWKESFYSLLFPRYMHMLSAPTPEEKEEFGNMGFIDYAVKKLKNVEKYFILISPEGDTSRHEWKSGYYVLAKKLKIPILVVGIDFAEHNVKIPMIINPNWLYRKYQKDRKNKKNKKYMKLQVITYYEDVNNHQIKCKKKNEKDIIEKLAMKGMSHIMPLNPESSFVKPQRYLSQPSLIPFHIKVIYFILAIILALLIFWLIRKLYYWLVKESSENKNRPMSSEIDQIGKFGINNNLSKT